MDVRKLFLRVNDALFQIKLVISQFIKRTKSLAVVIINHTPQLSEEQEKNVDSCFLNAPPDADFYVLLPRNIDGDYYRWRYPEAKVLYLEGWLSSHEAYNSLKTSAYFYLLFAGYEWILTFEPDAFLYVPNLNSYITQSYDYWGAPWVKLQEQCYRWVGVGNSGFSLRRTSVFLHYFKVREYLKIIKDSQERRQTILTMLFRLLCCLQSSIPYRATAPRLLEKNLLEDGFWSSTAFDNYYRDTLSAGLRNLFGIWFLGWNLRKPKPQDAAGFSVEQHPRFALTSSGKQVPTGSHALKTWEPDFHIEILRQIKSRKIRVYYHRNASWERDYILSLFPDVLSIELSEWSTLNDLIQLPHDPDVLVLSSQHIGQREALLILKKYRIKLCVLCSDENGGAKNWGRFVRANLFLKNYGHGSFTHVSLSKVQLPLGFMNGAFEESPWKQAIISAKKRFLPWAFVGNIKQDRLLMIQQFSKYLPSGQALTDGSVTPAKMIEIYRKSVFVPNGRGQVSLDCFRIYEAMFAGAIPVIVASSREFERTFSYNDDPPPILVFRSWEEAAQTCAKYLENAERLRSLMYRNVAWIRSKISFIRRLIANSLLNQPDHDNLLLNKERP